MNVRGKVKNRNDDNFEIEVMGIISFEKYVIQKFFAARNTVLQRGNSSEPNFGLVGPTRGPGSYARLVCPARGPGSWARLVGPARGPGSWARLMGPTRGPGSWVRIVGTGS